MIIMVLVNMKRVFFFFLHVVRHPADSDVRPTAGAQVGYQWYHDIRTTLDQRCTAECRVDAESC